MTREERHIAVLNKMLESMDVYDSIQPTTERKKAIKAAIQALENHDTFMKYAYSQGKHDALSQEQISLNDINNALEASFRNGVRSAKVEQEPCDDAISRDMALEKMADYVASGYADSVEDFEEYSRIICQLPSVTQKSESLTEFADRCRECGARYGKLLKQKSGKWIGIDEEPHEDYECSCCGYVVSTFTANIEPHTEYKYCPNCGAKMVEPQESEEISERNMKMWEEIFKAERSGK